MKGIQRTLIHSFIRPFLHSLRLIRLPISVGIVVLIGMLSKTNDSANERRKCEGTELCRSVSSSCSWDPETDQGDDKDAVALLHRLTKRCQVLDVFRDGPGQFVGAKIQVFFLIWIARKTFDTDVEGGDAV